MLGKLLLWALAIVGGAFVVNKYIYPFAPSLTGDGTDNNLLGMGKPSMKVTSCNDNQGSPVPGNGAPSAGYQSSPFWRWCYIVKPGESAGSISERITGDSSRYIELLTANPNIPKKGKMGEVVGPDAWDFADGALVEGTKIFIPQTMNAWVDQMGVTKAGHYPFPPDPRSIVEANQLAAKVNPSAVSPAASDKVMTSGDGYEVEDSGGDGFDYQEA